MVDKLYQVVWTKRSQIHLAQLFEYIKKDSPRNASKVLNDITASVFKASKNPERYPPDKYKIDNDGSFRAFEIHRYRIVYRFSQNVIRVLRVRHTSMEPLPY
jgi:plasmid stabilization system protein ParE